MKRAIDQITLQGVPSREDDDIVQYDLQAHILGIPASVLSDIQDRIAFADARALTIEWTMHLPFDWLDHNHPDNAPQ